MSNLLQQRSQRSHKQGEDICSIKNWWEISLKKKRTPPKNRQVLQVGSSQTLVGQSEKAMAPHSNTLSWKIPWTEEPGRLQSVGSLRVRQDWVTSLSLFTFLHWRRKWQPTPVFLPGESQGRGAWWAAIYGVAQSQTRLKWRSSSSSSSSRAVIN